MVSEPEAGAPDLEGGGMADPVQVVYAMAIYTEIRTLPALPSEFSAPPS